MEFVQAGQVAVQEEVFAELVCAMGEQGGWATGVEESPDAL